MTTTVIILTFAISLGIFLALIGLAPNMENH